MNGLLQDNIITRNGDTLEEDWPYFDDENEYDALQLDGVVSNPPYSQNWDPTDKDVDARYKRYGVAPRAKADYAFLLHDLFHVKPDGIMTIILPHGVLFRGGEEKNIRKNLIEENNIDCIIGLPPNIFYGTGIPTIIMILKKVREKTDIQFIDASKGFIKEGKNNKLRASDIKRIIDAVINRKNIEKFSRVVSRDEIRENDYNLNIPRYVDSSEEAEAWDIYATMFGGIPNTELSKFDKYWKALPMLKEAMFEQTEKDYSQLAVENVGQFIKEHSDVKNYTKGFNATFSDFALYLYDKLIRNITKINIAGEEENINNEIFSRMAGYSLIDKYQAYQLLDDEWNKISVDLEIIQTEGFDATKKVDPNMVVKKKNGKEEEVQEGWIGHVIPFEIVQENMLFEDLYKIKQKEVRVLDIASEYEDILNSLSEDDKEELKDILNETNDAFIPKEVTKKAKEIRGRKAKLIEGSLEDKILRVSDLQEEEKQLKKDIKTETDKLHIKTKETIENLSDEEVNELLRIKWINPLTNNISKLPVDLINDFSKQIQELVDKYKITFWDIEKQIIEAENELCMLIEELDGNEYDMKGLSEFQSLLRGE